MRGSEQLHYFTINVIGKKEYTFNLYMNQEKEANQFARNFLSKMEKCFCKTVVLISYTDIKV